LSSFHNDDDVDDDVGDVDNDINIEKVVALVEDNNDDDDDGDNDDNDGDGDDDDDDDDDDGNGDDDGGTLFSTNLLQINFKSRHFPNPNSSLHFSKKYLSTFKHPTRSKTLNVSQRSITALIPSSLTPRQ